MKGNWFIKNCRLVASNMFRKDFYKDVEPTPYDVYRAVIDVWDPAIEAISLVLAFILLWIIVILSFILFPISIPVYAILKKYVG